MIDISINNTYGQIILSTLHDILSNIDGSDIVLIGDVGSWGDTLEDADVFDDIRSWIETVAGDQNRTEILKVVEGITFNPDHPDRQIIKLLIVVFDLLSLDDHTVQNALKLWLKGGIETDVLTQLDEFMKICLRNVYDLITDPIKLEQHHETTEHAQYLYEFYTERRKYRIEAIDSLTSVRNN